MTIASATLTSLFAATRLEATKAAIVASLRGLLPGVAVVTHPGKLDINDVLDKAIVAAPGIALGWSRMRAPRDVGGTFGLPVDWAAYLVVEDYPDRSTTPPRSVPREVVAHAIGAQLLRILADTDTASWGLTGLYPPETDPAPEMRPLVTMTTAEQATAVYAVTWTQVLAREGRGLFAFGGDPVIRNPDMIPPDGMEFDIDLPDGDLPTELLAVLRGGEPL